MPTATPREDTSSGELTRDAIYNVLSNQRRRYTLHYLARQDGTVDLRDLSKRIAAWEHDEQMVDVTWEQRKNVYTALQQVHLPRMDEAGIVDFDRNRGEITLRDDVENLQPYLDFVPENEIAWNKYYLGLTGLSGCSLTLAEVGLVPFSAIPPIAWAAFVIILFGASAVSQTYYSRQIRLGKDGQPPGYEYERREER